MYEAHHEVPLSRREFAGRMLRHLGVAFLLLLFSLGIGMTGYAWFEHLAPADAFLNAAMLLSGMGPVNAPVTFGGKIFAGCYALYAGLMFIGAAALVFTPVVHRLLHRFHWKT